MIDKTKIYIIAISIALLVISFALLLLAINLPHQHTDNKAYDEWIKHLLEWYPAYG